MYCGNNRNNPDLVAGVKILGTRYDCFRKGVGVGLHLPPDPDYAIAYDPIDDSKVYCGNQIGLPVGYDRAGNLPTCLQKGVSIGKLLRMQREQKENKENKYDGPDIDLYGEIGEIGEGGWGIFNFFRNLDWIDWILVIGILLLVGVIVFVIVFLKKRKQEKEKYKKERNKK